MYADAEILEINLDFVTKLPLSFTLKNCSVICDFLVMIAMADIQARAKNN